jgi:hypothetical protein
MPNIGFNGKISHQILKERRFDNQMSIMRIASTERVLNVPPAREQ